ncbi:MAG: GAF domain-containing protein [candidate division Zixibacteria bacterium]|nr:GAF domain-containing protein [candidate division Zixibacteria bacterium]
MGTVGKINRQHRDRSSPWETITLVCELAALCRSRPASRETFELVLQKIRRIVPHDAATLYLLNRRNDKLEEAATVGGRVEPVSFIRMGKGDGLTGWTAENQKPVLISGRSAAGSDRSEGEYATFLSVPLVTRDAVRGVLNLGNVREQAYDQHDVSLMILTADQLAVAVESMSCQSELDDLNAQMAQAQLKLEQAGKSRESLNKMKEVARLAASINHEINNPLSVIIGNVQCLLLEKVAANQKALSRLRRIEEAAVRVGQVNRKLIEIHSLANILVGDNEDQPAVV